MRPAAGDACEVVGGGIAHTFCPLAELLVQHLHTLLNRGQEGAQAGLGRRCQAAVNQRHLVVIRGECSVPYRGCRHAAQRQLLQRGLQRDGGLSPASALRGRQHNPPGGLDLHHAAQRWPGDDEALDADPLTGGAYQAAQVIEGNLLHNVAAQRSQALVCPELPTRHVTHRDEHEAALLVPDDARCVPCFAPFEDRSLAPADELRDLLQQRPLRYKVLDRGHKRRFARPAHSIAEEKGRHQGSIHLLCSESTARWQGI
mmetsp:Transcript_102979/g.266290  ORF Transcript_102979/g.266290 Transcript_102979/m.266290 type:complete len:258 (-) Transcript_102979:906-1679(-)